MRLCACEPGWTCPKCRDTPSDHRYELDEPEPFEDLVGGAVHGAGRMSERESLFSYLRIGWNFVQAKLHHSYPCGRCGYRYDCPDGECHS